MKHTWKAAAAGALAVLFVSPHAQAQLAVAKVVAVCGTTSPTPHAGSNYPLTIDITGTLCSVGGGGGGGGVVTQPNASLLNATVFPAPDVATNTPITAQDAGTTCASTPAPVQSQCTGTATAGSVASVAISGQQGAAVVASLTSGTVATVNFSSEFSWDGGATWYGRGLFLDSNVAPIWKNGIGNNVFSGSTSVPPGATNYRVRAQALTGTSPNINIKIILTQSNSGTYVYNLPTAAAGISSVAAVNIQGEASGAPVITNQTQLAGSALSVPTATGVAPAGGALVQNVNASITGGSVTATFSQFAPNGNYASLAVGASSARVALPSGTTVAIYNTGSNAASVLLGNASVVAVATNDQVAPGGQTCLAVGANVDIATIEAPSATGTSSLVISGGSGGCAASGGGSGASSANASVGATGSAAPASATYNGMLVSGGNMVGASGSVWGAAPTGLNVLGINADILASVLPTGAATAANQNATAAGTSASSAQAVQGVTGGVPIPVNGGVSQATNSVPINISTATTTQLVALSAGKVIQVTGWDVLANGTGNFMLEYGTSANCAAGATPLTGNYNLIAQAGMSRPGGLGPQLFVPAGDALCAVTSAAVGIAGSVSYLQF